MSTLLEITGDDIALLSDADLRSLIGLLCEADFRQAGLPTKGIFWSGHQDAPDDGVDVSVRSEVAPPESSLVPRSLTVFQVKQPDMGPSRIKHEMRPQGEIRGEIKSLINQGGAYIIVSSKGSTTEKALRDRIAAMRAAVADEPHHQQLHLDFLDRGRIATWVRNHPSLIIWVRDRVGRVLHGWKSYDNWAKAPGGIEEEFIVGEESRFITGSNIERGEPVIAGLQKIRARLSQNGTSVRLTGLSGVGKTRLAQALFDDRIGDYALNQYWAHYTDIADGPIPDPTFFANQLVARKTKAILIIDNCSPNLHRKLTEICKSSPVSLLTIEYDIRDDIPEETDVFRLEPLSDILIRKLLDQHYGHISQIDRQTITELASGNARVAITLANTFEKDEGFSTLRDEELFNRLFHQRHHPTDDLRITAEICSLVYSFNGEDTISATSELGFLGALAEKSSRDVYRDIAELKNRGVVQARSVWRSILPHAIANRLAKSALDSIPTQSIVKAFLSSDSERLITSFSRRLSYLHDCGPAVKIAEEWLRPDGWIGEANCNLNSFGQAILLNIAPIVPEATLTTLERAANDNNSLAKLLDRNYVRLLKHLAYDADLFQRSANLLSRLTIMEDAGINDSSSARAVLKRLFQVIYSGTHAEAQVRANMIKKLISSSTQPEQALGIDLLDVALTTHFLSPNYDGAFGSRPRNFGYRPKSSQEMVNWYRVFLDICTQTALSDDPIAINAKRVLENRLRDLWAIGANIDLEFLEDLCSSTRRIHAQESWNAGWISAQAIIRYDGERMSYEAKSKLEKLSYSLKPIRLLERARTYALSNDYLIFDPEDGFGEVDDVDQWKRNHDKTRRIGLMVAQDDAVFTELLPDIVSNYSERLSDFGAGLADGSQNRKLIWQTLYKQLERTPSEKRQIAVMLGFLSSCAIHEPELYQSILDSLIKDQLLGQWFPYFQMTSEVDKRGVERLIYVLDEQSVNIYSFEHLASGRRHEAINDDDLALLLQKLLNKAGGIWVAIRILNMRFYREKEELPSYSEKLIGIARQALLQFPHEIRTSRKVNVDYELARIASVSLGGQEGVKPTSALCQQLAEGFKEYQIYSFDFPRLLKQIALIQPIVFLNTFVGIEDDYIFRVQGFDDLETVDNPINQIPDAILLEWCEQDPRIRYQLIVSAMQLCIKSKDSEELTWLPILSLIFDKAPNIQTILAILERKIHPMSWSGSYADALAKGLSLFRSLSADPNSEIQNWSIDQNQKLQLAIQKQRDYESRENQERFERFE